MLDAELIFEELLDDLLLNELALNVEDDELLEKMLDEDNELEVIKVLDLELLITELLIAELFIELELFAEDNELLDVEFAFEELLLSNELLLDNELFDDLLDTELDSADALLVAELLTAELELFAANDELLDA